MNGYLQGQPVAAYVKPVAACVLPRLICLASEHEDCDSGFSALGCAIIRPSQGRRDIGIEGDETYRIKDWKDQGMHAGFSFGERLNWTSYPDELFLGVLWDYSAF